MIPPRVPRLRVGVHARVALHKQGCLQFSDHTERMLLRSRTMQRGCKFVREISVQE